MFVHDCMTRDPTTIPPHLPIGEAAALMGKVGHRRLLVAQGDRLVGVVTKWDILGTSPPEINPFSAHGALSPALAGPVRTIMATQLVTTTPDTPLEEAARLMLDRKLGALPVLLAGRLVGIVTNADVMRAFVSGLRGSGPGLRVVFDVAPGEEVIPFAVELAKRHKMTVVSAWTVAHDERRTVVLRLAGHEPPALVEEIWKTGHRVMSVLRFPG